MKTRKLKQRNFFFCLLCLPFGKIKNLPKVFIYSFILLSVHGWGDGNCTKVSLLLSPAEDECGDSDPRGALSSCFHQRISRDGGEPLPNSNRFKIDTNHNYSFSDIYSRFSFFAVRFPILWHLSKMECLHFQFQHSSPANCTASPVKASGFSQSPTSH